MRCTRCGASVIKTELYQGVMKLDSISAWRCGHCGLIEYRDLVAIRLREKLSKSPV